MTEAREAAVERIEARRHYREQILRYVAVNGFFVALWALGGGGFFWPALTLIGRGLHLDRGLLKRRDPDRLTPMAEAGVPLTGL